MQRLLKQYLAALIIVLVVIAAAFAFYRATRLHFIRQYLGMWHQVWKLEAQSLQDESFFPAGAPADALERSESFFVQDTRDKVWIFTPALCGLTADVARSRSRFMRVCGFAAARVEKVSLPLNNRVYDGSVEEHAAVRMRVDGKEQFVSLDEKAAATLLSGAIVFDYLFGPQSGVVWVLEGSEKVRATRGTQYRLHEKLDPAGCHILCPDILRRLDAPALGALNAQLTVEHAGIPSSQEDWALYFSPRTLTLLAAAASVNRRPDIPMLARTAHFIREIPEEIFLEVFRIAGIHGTAEYAAYTRALLERKRGIVAFMGVFLRQAADTYEEPFVPEPKKEYTIKDFKDIISVLRQEQIAAAKEAAVVSAPSRQRMLVMAESPEARFVVRYFCECALNLDEAIAALVRLRQMAAHPREKEAVDFFIKEIVTGHIAPMHPCTERIPAAN